MADNLPVNFAIPGESAVASYSYSDIANATGYVDYYLGKGTDVYLTSKNSFYSNKVITGATLATAAGLTKVNDVDFDIKMELQQRLRGLAIVNIPVAINIHQSAKNCTTYVIVKIRKYTAEGVETEIANNQSDTFDKTSTGTGQYFYTTFCVEVDIPLTDFKATDKIRITIEQWGTVVTAAGSAGIMIAHDPKNRITSGNEPVISGAAGTDPATWDANYPSVMIASLPYKLDL